MSDELFSYRLRKYREEHHVSQEEMGAVLGVTARYVGMMERGDKDVEPTSALAKLFSLLEANKVPLDQLAGRRSLDVAPVMTMTREEPRAYRPMPKNNAAPTQQRHALMIERVKEDTADMMKSATPAQRRELALLAKTHIDQVMTWLNASEE
jgi:transcriptional regulator with XRE-family HTH domain